MPKFRQMLFPLRARTSHLRHSCLAAAFLVVSACGDNSKTSISDIEGQDITSCSDKDGDGYGAGCVYGRDCNDKDPAVTTECYKCNQNAEGCPCQKEGESIACGEVAPDSSGCIHGTRVCSKGAWSACVSDGTGAKPLPPGWAPSGLGGTTTACQNAPCDPYCQHYPDVPDPTLTNDAGIQGTDSGLQLTPLPVDAGLPQACVSQTAQATPIPLDIFIMLDQSGSMSGTSWDAVKTAIGTFVDSASATGIGVGLGLFPVGYTSCTVSDYKTPKVAIGTLPGNAATIKSNIPAFAGGSGTPTRPALDGAIQYAKLHAIANPTHKVVVVVATDGQPNSCSPTCDVANVSAIATGGLSGTPSIPTYVIGVGSSTGNLDSIALAGGTLQAYMVTSGNPQSFLDAMQAIRQQALGCDYSVPVPSSGDLDPDATSVTFRLGTGSPITLAVAASEAACGTNDGYYYDNATNPTKLILCPTTCTTVKSDASYKVDLTFACKASCGSSSAAVTPIPLDMYVMLDKSGSMDWDGPPSRWDAVTTALKAFVNSSSSDGIGMGLGYFPGTLECSATTYSTPSVGIADLPANSTLLKNSLDATGPGGGTPTRVALEGAINYARDRAIAFPANKVVVVLATDGEPNNCSSTVLNVAEVAADGFNGVSTSSTPYSPVVQGTDPVINIASTGTATVKGNNVVGGPYPIGFTAKFFGLDYTQFWVSTNGFISLQAPTTSAATNQVIPYTPAPGAILAPFWDDLLVTTSGNIYYAVQGIAPNRQLIVQWTGTMRYKLLSPTGNLSFEIVLSEDGTISYRYGALIGPDSYSTGARGATIGFENFNGTQGVQYSYNTQRIIASTSLTWAPYVSTATYPSIPTYVIGIGAATTGLTQIAAAGGTGSPFMVTGGNSAQFLIAMQKIRQQALGCDYAIPTTTLGLPDFDKMSVRFTPSSGLPQTLPKVSGALACGSNPGYYYDDPLAPTQLTLCQSSCDAVALDPNAKVNIFYDCMPSYPDGTFTRDYSSEGICPPGSTPLWGSWKWTASTPGNSRITFTVAVASTAAGLNSAAAQDLLYSYDPDAGLVVGQPVVAATPNSNGDTSVDNTLALKVMDRKAPFLRIRANLIATSPDKLQTPLLTAWDLGISCEASE